MDLYPAIDLLGGDVVRLTEGAYDRVTTYGTDPVEVARSFAAAGAPWIHVVDLDAARTGSPLNRDVIAAVAAAVPVPVQAGGGVRDEAAAAALLDAGVTRVVIGTAAVEAPDLVRRLAAGHPGGVAVGFDTRQGEVAVRGWTEGTGTTVADLLPVYVDAGVAALVVTDIGRDGTFRGPALDAYAELLAATDLPLVASGGVGSLDDLRALAALEVEGRRLEGAIVGKALHDGRITVDDALTAAKG